MAVGYSRAVQVGPYVAVAGTTGSGPAGDIAAQAEDALRRIEIALQQAGASLTDVLRTRIYVTDISRWREVAAVHARVFGRIRPAATMVEVSALIAPELLWRSKPTPTWSRRKGPEDLRPAQMFPRDPANKR